MRNQAFLWMVVLLTGFLLASCKKDKDQPSYEIEYKVNTPNLNAFTSIKYTDASGNAVEAVEDIMATWSQKITVTQKPFTAKLTGAINNYTTTALYYDLIISVNGEVKKVESGAVPAGSISETQAEYTVN